MNPRFGLIPVARITNCRHEILRKDRGMYIKRVRLGDLRTLE